MSPFCPGTLLADRTSAQAYELRGAITARLERGETAAAVRADLVRQHGSAILRAPELTGAGLLAWLMPAVIGPATAAGIGMKVAHARRETLASQIEPAAVGTGTDTVALARLDDDCVNSTRALHAPWPDGGASPTGCGRLGR